MRLRLLPVLFLLTLALAACGGTRAEAERFEARPLVLDPEAPERQRVGALSYRGGLLLSSDSPRFGGLSGLAVSPDGSRLLAVGDEGLWVSARLLHDRRGFLAGIAEPRFGALLDETGQPLGADKRRSDAEAATIAGDGRLLVAFEREHRILAYRLEDFRPAGVPERLEAPAHPQRSNGGTEALASLPDGRLLAFSEGLTGLRDGVATRRAFLADRPGAPWQPLDLVKPDSLSPVDAAALPNGTVLLLERHWSPFPGLALRVSRIPGEALAPGSHLAPEWLALLAPPLNVDNMEGLAVRQDGAGRVFLYLLSDDNFNALQRTLLLLFELDQAGTGLPRKP